MRSDVTLLTCQPSIIIVIIMMSSYIAHIQCSARFTHMFIHVPFKLPFFEHTTLAAISALGTNRTYCLPGTHSHLSQVKHVRVKCLAQGHSIEIMPRY